MLLAMFAGEHRDDWDDLLPAVMMAYRSSVHESTGLSPYHLMFGTPTVVENGPICSGSQSNSPITPNTGNEIAISRRPPDIEGVLRLLMSGTVHPESTYRTAVPKAGMGQQRNLPVSRVEGSEMVCFLSGRLGHGVSRCPRIDVDFPFMLPGWSVEHRDGQFRATWPQKTPGRLLWGKPRLVCRTFGLFPKLVKARYSQGFRTFGGRGVECDLHDNRKIFVISLSELM